MQTGRIRIGKAIGGELTLKGVVLTDPVSVEPMTGSDRRTVLTMLIRPYQPNDLDDLKRMTIEGFDGIAIDQNVEKALGVLGGREWRWRKARHVDDDVAANPAGVFVAVDEGKILGYISTRLDRESRKGRISNMAVVLAARGRGIGRQLIEHALDYMRREGMALAMIETMANNAVGQHLYPSCGFVEVGRQIHYARKL